MGYGNLPHSLDDMVRRLKTAEAGGRLTDKLHTYLRPSVLMADGVGYQPWNALRWTWSSR